MKVAVSYLNGEIYEHFGHAEMFAIYDFDMDDLNNTTKRLIDVSALAGHTAMVERLQQEGVDAVICGNMGPAAKAMLLTAGIVPVVGYCDFQYTHHLSIIICRFGCGGALPMKGTMHEAPAFASALPTPRLPQGGGAVAAACGGD